MKKIFAIILTVCILLGLMVVPVSADIGDHDFVESEPNDTKGTSDRIYSDYTVYGKASVRYDMDYFKFTLSSSSNIDITCVSDYTGLYVILLDSNENVLGGNITEYTNGSTIGCTYSCSLPAGTYYVNISNDVDASSYKYPNGYAFYFEIKTHTHTHTYTNTCDSTCNGCGATRTITHTYTNGCDTSCNVCGLIRTTSHKFGNYIYNNDADSFSNGTKTRSCSVCGHKETIDADGKFLNSSALFSDVSRNSWFKKYVDYAITYGIFKGTTVSTFSPETNMTRAQMVQVFANLSGIDTTDNNVDSGFSDVPKGMWYTSAVTWAAKNKIVTGVGDGKFDPDAKITREQMCLMLVNYIEKYLGKTLEPEKDVTTFADNKDISDWAKDAVYKCARAGLVNGIGNNVFDPKASATRAQGATLFSNFHLEYMK